ncbi:hypothetical protein RCL_jg20546.t1 [Rhizophagus clarus]|uniref:Uncharacterized protein n=1 Tax=Rhizophagus clarus TaxID=94130 RepID=A0A8H3LXQ7_9GLOM|nr:hypothetical protein RCL_jg20546.t1 [Rhizophagus clarus]
MSRHRLIQPQIFKSSDQQEHKQGNNEFEQNYYEFEQDHQEFERNHEFEQNERNYGFEQDHQEFEQDSELDPEFIFNNDPKTFDGKKNFQTKIIQNLVPLILLH